MNTEEGNSIVKLPDYGINIRNRILRSVEHRKLQRQKRKTKKEEKKKQKNYGKPKKIPKTIDDLREPDVTTVADFEDTEKKEIELDIKFSEYAPYFQKTYEPKVLITFSGVPAKKTKYFGRELMRIIPNSSCKQRKSASVRKIIGSCIRQDFSDIIIINENMDKPNGLMVVHLPKGPTVNFRLSNVKTSAELRRDYKEISEHRPEVILNNFSTRLGNSVASILAALFHYEPQFRGRRVVTFHNQRDYIFFRHHRYQFKKNGERVALQELGPRFTLKLRWLQSGVFDSKTGEYEWTISGRRHEMETSRRKFFL